MEQKKQKPSIKVKELKGSPFFISQESKDVLGEGSFGKVVRAYDINNPNEDLVAKIIQLDEANKLKSMLMELKVLQKLPPNLNLVGYKRIKLSGNNKQYFIMDYCNGGTLGNYMKTNKNMSEIEIINFLHQFCRGYQVLLNNGIIHRDIKPDNILIHNKVFKIADFGLAKIVETISQNMNMSTRGTPLYISPELIQKQTASSKVDVWSLGIVLFRLLFNNQQPFLVEGTKYNVQTAYKDILGNKLIIPLSNRSKELVKLCEAMLIKDKDKRISWEEIFEHPLIRDAFNLEKMQIELNDNNDNKINHDFLKSSVYAQQLEIVKVSRIRMQHFDSFNKDQPRPQLAQTNINSDPNNNKIDNKTKQLQPVIAEILQETDLSMQNQQIVKKNQDKIQVPQISKIVLDQDDFVDKKQLKAQILDINQVNEIVERTKRRQRQTQIIQALDDYFLKEREKVLFYIKIANQLNIFQNMFDANNFQNISQKMKKVELLLIIAAIKYNSDLQLFKLIDGKFKIYEWNIFCSSENYYQIKYFFRQDEISLKENIEKIRNLSQLYSNYFQEIIPLNDLQFELEFKLNLASLLKYFHLLYFSFMADDQNKTVAIIFNYLLQIYDEKRNIISGFEKYTDFYRYFERIEQQLGIKELTTLVNQNLQNANLLLTDDMPYL